jgi:hypothetical protein
LKLRRDQGDIYTDFDLGAPAPVPPAAAADDRDKRGRSRTTARTRVDTAVYGSVSGGGPEFEVRTCNGDIFVRKGH